MKIQFTGAATQEKMGVAYDRQKLKQLPVQRPPLQMVAESINSDQQMSDSTTATRSQLTPGQKARLAVVMAREARGGGHLTDVRHMAEMPNYRPSVLSGQEEKTIVARGHYAD